MNGMLNGSVVLVTGAGGGIGLATAWGFAEAGASVVLADRDERSLSRSIEEIRAAGHNAIGLGCDVTNKAQVTAMIEQAVATYGRLDAAFNNAVSTAMPCHCWTRAMTSSIASSTSTCTECGTA